MVSTVPELLFPAFKMQEKLRHAIMGEQFWIDYTQRLRAHEQRSGNSSEPVIDRLLSLMKDEEAGAAEEHEQMQKAVEENVFPQVFSVAAT